MISRYMEMPPVNIPITATGWQIHSAHVRSTRAAAAAPLTTRANDLMSAGAVGAHAGCAFMWIKLCINGRNVASDVAV